MNSRKLRKQKKGTARKIVGALMGIVIVLAVLAFGLVLLGRYVIGNNTDNILEKAVPYSQTLTDASGKLAPAKPEAIVSKLNENESSIITRSQGFIDSAQASTDGQTLEYTVSSSKMNGLLANGLLTTNGDQLKNMVNKVLDSMKSAGVEQPQVVLKLTDNQGNLIKTVDYQ